MIIRPAGVTEAGPLARLHAAAFPRSWSVESFADSIAASGTSVLIAELDEAPVGVLVWRDLRGEAEILTVAVASRFRRRGIAMRLVYHALVEARNAEAAVTHLEVAGSNLAAIRLYERCGFRVCGRRKHYYPADDGGREDACLMRHAMAAELDGASARS